MIDTRAALTWSIFLAGLSSGLRKRQITGPCARNLLLGLFSSIVCVYVAETFVDFAQCHFQVGGIGTHCHGYNCLHISASLTLKFSGWRIQAAILLRRVSWGSQFAPTLVGIARGALTVCVLYLSCSCSFRHSCIWRRSSTGR